MQTADCDKLQGSVEHGRLFQDIVLEASATRRQLPADGNGGWSAGPDLENWGLRTDGASPGTFGGSLMP